jgi:predicted house-cleaning noncanonical NTP pyrophosphatase (MazG superfamily)
MRTTHNKLVRDRIPQIIAASGRRPVTRVLDEAAYRQALRAKLVEEAREASQAAGEDLAAELADVLEVTSALANASGVSWHELLALTATRNSQRGGFQDRIFLECTEEPEQAG